MFVLRIFIISFLVFGMSQTPAKSQAYHCKEVPGSPPKFVCKFTLSANKHIRQVFSRGKLVGLRESLARLGEIHGLPSGTPMAYCTGGRGIANARLDSALLQGLSPSAGIGRQPRLGSGDISRLGNGLFEVKGNTAAQIAAGCSGGGGASAGTGGDRQEDGRGGLGGHLNRGSRLDTPQQAKRVARARQMLAGLAVCSENNNDLIASPGAAGGGTAGGAAAAGGEKIFDLANTVLGAIAQPIGQEVAENMFEQHFMGADYVKEGTLVGPGVLRFSSKTDPENSYLEVYGPANLDNVQEGTKVAVNKKTPDGGSFVASESPDGKMQMVMAHANGDVTVVISGGGKSTITKTTADADMPAGDLDLKDVVSVTTEYVGNWDDKDKKVHRTTTTYRDGSQDIQEYDENGNPKGPPKHVEAGEADTPLPDNPDMGTCEGRARWVALMTAFCDAQNWQPPTCQAILLFANGCSDPGFTDPTPDGDDLVCKSDRDPQELAAAACERRKMIELVFPDSPRASCQLPNLSKSLLIKDPGTIDPVPVDARLRPTIGRQSVDQPSRTTSPETDAAPTSPTIPDRCSPGQLNCAN